MPGDAKDALSRLSFTACWAHAGVELERRSVTIDLLDRRPKVGHLTQSRFLRYSRRCKKKQRGGEVNWGAPKTRFMK